MQNNGKIVKFLIEKGAEGQVSDLLMLAVRYGKELIDSVKVLVNKGADVNSQMEGTKWTAGHAATKRGNLEILELLLKNGASQDTQACHRDFGKNLCFADVTSNERVLQLLQTCL